MIKMISKIIFLLTFWVAGAISTDAIETLGAAKGNIATSCENLSIHTTTSPHRQVTLDLFGFCTYDGLSHDFATESYLFRSTCLDLTKIIANGPSDFHWVVNGTA